jgi:predicted ATP-grasp superfamily ATP-dependent carboligase
MFRQPQAPVTRRGRDRHPATILVTDAGRGSALAIIRSLGRAGYRVVAADCDRCSAGFASRYASERVVYPPPDSDPEGAARLTLDVAPRLGVDLIIPVTDWLLLPLSAMRECFDDVCDLAAPSPEALAMASDKAATLVLAERLDVPVPRTHLVETVGEAIAATRDLTWPVVLKPRASRLRRGGGMEAFTVAYARDPEDLAERMAPLEGRCAVLLQEYCAGVGVGVEMLLHQGRLLAAFQHRRLREVPVSGGASAFRESVPLDPVLLDYAISLLRELSWTGLAMVEFKVGPDGPRLMEVNGRVWGSLPLAVMSGVDFPRLLTEMLLEGPPPAGAPPVTAYRVGVRARSLPLDIAWMGAVLLGRRRPAGMPMPSRLAAVGAALQLLDPTCRTDSFAWDDPRPYWREWAALAGSLPDRLRSHGGGA